MVTRRQFFQLAAGAVALAAIPELPGFDALPIAFVDPASRAVRGVAAITNLRLTPDLRSLIATEHDLVTVWLVSPRQRFLLVATRLPAGTRYLIEMPIVVRADDRLVVEGPAVVDYELHPLHV